MDIKLVVIDSENIEGAVFVQHIVFPHDSARQNYYESINKVTNNIYCLLYLGEKCIGISGLYYYDIDPRSAWLGWFGIIPEYRNKGYGKVALNLFLNECKERNYMFARLYTDEIDNADAVKFYLHNGFTFERYENSHDITKYNGNILIGSKNLGNTKLELWNNKYLGFDKQLIKQGNA